MATFTSTACQTSSSGFFLNAPKFIENGVIARTALHTFSVAQSSGDIVQMVPVPKGAHIHDVIVNYSGLGGAAVTTTVGDGNSATRYNGSVSSNLANVVRATAGLGYSYSAEDTIDIVIGTATSASAATSIRLTVVYSMDQALDGGS
jgi:hypothetical protein